MRLWSLHPCYLDSKGLVALWRESLLAQKVLRGKTRGYRHHPQLERFRGQVQPLAAISTYLNAVADEACNRGYHFDRRRIGRSQQKGQIAVTNGQLRHEYRHLATKLRKRSPDHLSSLPQVSAIKPHPLFYLITGPVEKWERGKSGNIER